VEYDRGTGRLLLTRLGLLIKKEQHIFLLENYKAVLDMIDRSRAQVHFDRQDEVVVDIAGLKVVILHGAHDILTLRELFIENVYGEALGKPAVVWDIGMGCGLTSLYFASQFNAVVIGFEPRRMHYDQALRNLSLNQAFRNQIKVLNAGIGDFSSTHVEGNDLAASAWYRFGDFRTGSDNSYRVDDECRFEDARDVRVLSASVHELT